jgi:hypothetical protein
MGTIIEHKHIKNIFNMFNYCAGFSFDPLKSLKAISLTPVLHNPGKKIEAFCPGVSGMKFLAEKRDGLTQALH